MSGKRRSTQRRRQPCVLLLDENVYSEYIMESLRRLDGWIIEGHPAHFDQGAEDHKVVKYCGERGWALVSCDEMRYTPETKAAIKEYEVRVLKVIPDHEVEATAALVLARNRIIQLLHTNRAALCAHVRKNGYVEVMTRYEEFEAAALTAAQRRTMRKYGPTAVGRKKAAGG